MKLERQSDNHASRTERSTHARQVTPLVDIFESEKEYLLLADVPYAQEDAVQVRFEKNHLFLEAGFTVEGIQAPLTYRRTFQLPGSVNGEAIEAELSNGVLSVHLPKLDSYRPRQIAIRTA